MVAGEVKHPERSLPIALIAGVGVVGVLYMAHQCGHSVHLAGGADCGFSAARGGRDVAGVRPLGWISGFR